MKKIFKISIITAGLFCYGNFVSAEALNLPKDSEGWTIFTPSDDSRIIYVSVTGNDSTGIVYDDDDAVLGGQPFNPTGVINAFATYVAAYANTREGYPDWILMKRGDTFYQTIDESVRSGRSVSEPFLMGAYGSSGLSPLFKIGSSAGLQITKTSAGSPGTYQYIAAQGLRFYSHTRNPADPQYVNSGGSVGLNMLTYQPNNYIHNVLIEGCAFIFNTESSIQSGVSMSPITDIDIRRNVFTDNYDEVGHAQGMYAFAIDRILLEENIFDHNGWLIQSYNGDSTGGQATMFNHNTYFGSVNNATFRNNIFMRGSSMNNKFTAEYDVLNLLVDNNLYIDGEIGIGIDSNYPDNEWRVIDPVISNNVFVNIGESNPTNRDVAWTLWPGGWDGGEIKNNISINSSLSIPYSGQLNIGDQMRNVDIYDNIFFSQQNNGVGLAVEYQDGVGASSNVDIYGNYFEMPADGSLLVYGASNMNWATFSNNQWYDPTSPAFDINTTSYTTSQWASLIEPTATFAQKTFPDKTRSVGTYMALIGETATIPAFIAATRAQDRYSWDTRYDASTVNTWIKAGFTSGDVVAPSAPSNLSVL